MRRTLLVTLGWVLVVVGAIFTPLPPPFAFGGIMFIAGLSILTANSKTVRRWVQNARYRYKTFSMIVDRIDRILPNWMGGIGKRTAPEPVSRLRRQRDQGGSQQRSA